MLSRLLFLCHPHGSKHARWTTRSDETVLYCETIFYCMVNKAFYWLRTLSLRMNEFELYLGDTDEGVTRLLRLNVERRKNDDELKIVPRGVLCCVGAGQGDM